MMHAIQISYGLASAFSRTARSGISEQLSVYGGFMGGAGSSSRGLRSGCGEGSGLGNTSPQLVMKMLPRMMKRIFFILGRSFSEWLNHSLSSRVTEE